MRRKDKYIPMYFTDNITDNEILKKDTLLWDNNQKEKKMTPSSDSALTTRGARYIFRNLKFRVSNIILNPNTTLIRVKFSYICVKLLKERHRKASDFLTLYFFITTKFFLTADA